MRIAAWIPARGGSKGIPGKNLIPLGGRPLIQHSIDQALAIQELEGPYISTDSEEIADFCRRSGASVPRLRNPEFATDEAPVLGALRESLLWPELKGVDALLVLQPTSPLRRVDQVSTALERFRTQPVDALVSIVRVPHSFSPSSVMRMDKDGFVSPYIEGSPTVTRRQDKPLVFSRHGPAVLILSSDWISRCEGNLFSGRVAGFEIPLRDSVDIDTMEDLEWAEWLLSKRPK